MYTNIIHCKLLENSLGEIVTHLSLVSTWDNFITSNNNTMLEFKLIPSTILGRPKLAIVLSSIQAEPDAHVGVWCGSKGLDDMFIITYNTERAVEYITKLNNTNERLPIPIDEKILKYLNKPIK